MKKVKQIIILILIVLLSLLIGYLCYTGSQLNNLASTLASVGGIYV